MHRTVANDAGRARYEQHLLPRQRNGAGARKAGRARSVLCRVVVSGLLARVFDVACGLLPGQKVHVNSPALAAHSGSCWHLPRGLLIPIEKMRKGRSPSLVESAVSFQPIHIGRIDVRNKVPHTPQMRKAALLQQLEQFQIALLHRFRASRVRLQRQAEAAPQHLLVATCQHLAVLQGLHGRGAEPALLPQLRIGSLQRYVRIDCIRQCLRHAHMARAAIQHAP